MSDLLSLSAWRLKLVLALALVVGACSSPHAPDPSPLVPLSDAGQKTLQRLWSQQLQSVNYPAELTQQGDRVVVGGDDGQVFTVRLDDGRVVSRLDAGAHLSAAPGRDGALTAVVTTQNELEVFNDERLSWRTRLPTQVVTPPLVAGQRVFVLGVDRTVYALDALDGRKLWMYQRPSEPLALRQAGVLGAVGDTLWAGVGPRLMALDPTTGAVRQEVVVGTPRGTNEVERLNDLVGPALRVGDTICARAFQTAVGCVAANNGTLRWSRLNAGQRALGGDAELVFGADASDRITAWRAGNGDTAWTNERLLYRGLSAPLSVGKTVVFGDVEGQVHFLSREDGKTLLRLPTDGSPIVAQPVTSGGTVLVATRSGGLFAFRTD